MCGKFTQVQAWSQLVAFDDLQNALTPAGIETVTPMRLAHVIVCDDGGHRRTVPMRWGLLRPGTNAQPVIHARAETIDVKPTFRTAFAARRGILPVTTFNEGREITPTKTEQYVLTPSDGAPIGIAVVWERESPSPGGAPQSFAMVTVPPNALIATITDRMPALIDPADWPLWLGERPAPPMNAKALLKPSPRALDLRKADKPPPRKKDDGQSSLF